MMKLKIGNSGITLLEVLVAMIILSLALLVLLNMGMVALDGNDWSNKTTITSQLMQEKLEQLRSIKDDGMVSGADIAQGYARIWTVADAGNHLRQIEVSIQWEDVRGMRHVESMTAMVRTDSL